ncbi:MAG: hypothetical protein HGA85_06310, partial [Nanoarchaeota archaeon]|nr:hypothetical protein [Nanoarchaeota archaeon]
MKDHILNEAVARQNNLFGSCMYCHDPFGQEDKWKLENNYFATYVSVTCSSCH